MFVQENHISLLFYWEYTAHLDRTSPQGWGSLIYTAKKNYLLRIVATIDAFKAAIAGLIIQTTRALNELIIGILHFDSASIRNAKSYAIAALIDGIALPIIGLTGIISPTLSLTITAKVSEQAKKIVPPEKEFQLQTESFNQITARLISPLRGTTEAIDEVLRTLSNTISNLLIWPIDNTSLLNCVIIPFFRGHNKKPMNLLQESHSMGEAGIKFVTGFAGIFFEESRKYNNIYP